MPFSAFKFASNLMGVCKILFYPEHQASSSSGTKSCYTRLNCNFAVGAEMKGPPQSTVDKYSARVFENLKDGISIISTWFDCFLTNEMPNTYSVYVMIDMQNVMPVRNISLVSQSNGIVTSLFQDILIFVGNYVDEQAMDEKNFDLLELVGKTKPVQVVGERQSFVFDPPKFVRYVVLHKTVHNRIQICDIEIS